MNMGGTSKANSLVAFSVGQRPTLGRAQLTIPLSPGRLCEKCHFHVILVISSAGRNLTAALGNVVEGDFSLRSK